MMEWSIRRLLAALDDDRVRAAIAEIVEEAKPAQAPVHRPINELKIPQPRPLRSTNKAPGAI